MQNKVSLTSLIARTSRLYKTAVNIALKTHHINLSSEMCGVLLELWKSDGKSQQELATTFKKDKAGITRIVKSLAKRGLISSTQDPIDGRRKKITLTAKGKALQNQVEELIGNLRQEVLAGINKSEQEATEKVLYKIVTNLENFDKLSAD